MPWVSKPSVSTMTRCFGPGSRVRSGRGRARGRRRWLGSGSPALRMKLQDSASHWLRVHLGLRLVARARTWVPRCPLARAIELWWRGGRRGAGALSAPGRARARRARRGGEIEQGAVDRGGRDALVVGGVLGIEGACAVQADPRGAWRPRGAVTSMRVWSVLSRPQCAAALRWRAPRRARRPAPPPTGGPPGAARCAHRVDAVVQAVQPAARSQ